MCLCVCFHKFRKEKIRCYPLPGTHKGYNKKQESIDHSSSSLLITQIGHFRSKTSDCVAIAILPCAQQPCICCGLEFNIPTSK